ncbi:MAG: LysE family transporter [Chitinophagales bacterium]
MILIGFLLGFIGYLPPGNINLTVVQVALNSKRQTLWSFILFVALMEMIYCLACLSGLNYLLQQTHLLRILSWISVGLFLLLAAWILLQRERPADDKSVNHSLLRGILIAIFNPLQIPFWLAWGVYGFKNGWIEKSVADLALFSMLSAIGTMVVLWMYASAGLQLVASLNLRQLWLNRFIAGVLLLIATYQMAKLLFP